MLFGQRLLLATDLHLFQPRQLAQASFQNVFSLHLGQPEALHQHRFRLILGADDVNHFIQIEEGNQAAFEQVQAVLNFIQTILQAAAHGADTEGQPFAEQGAQVLHLGLAVQTDDIDVDPVRAFQLGGGEQMLHQLVEINAIGARNNHDATRVLVVRLVAQVGDHRQLLRLHLPGNLLQHLGAGHLMGQRGDHDVTVFDAVHGAHAHRAFASLVDFQQVGTRGDDLRFSRIIRALHVLAELLNRGARLVEQTHASGGHFAQVMRRHVGGHTHGDPGSAVQQQVGQTRRQYRRLIQGAVKVRHPIGSALAQLAEQGFGVTR